MCLRMERDYLSFLFECFRGYGGWMAWWSRIYGGGFMVER